MRQQTGRGLKTLGCPCNPRFAVQQRRQSLERCTKGVRGNRHQCISRLGESLAQIGRDLQGLGENGLGQIAQVAPGTLHRLDLLRIAPPEAGRMSLARELNGKSRAPGASADDRHWLRARTRHGSPGASLTRPAWGDSDACANKASKLTSGRRKFGNPPFTIKSEITSRA